MIFPSLFFLASVGTTVAIVYGNKTAGVVAIVAVMGLAYYARNKWWFF